MRRKLCLPVWRCRCIALAVVVAVLVPARSVARETARQAGVMGVISGQVVDAVTVQPLPDARVTLEPRGAGVINSGRRASAFLSGMRVVRTDTAGWYRFEDVANGEYRLHVALVGYHPATLDIEVRGAATPQVSIGLLVDPIELSPIEVSMPARATRADDGGAVGGPAGSETDELRLWIERLRQQRFLAPDVRTLTQEDVIEAVTLGETDLFRALQRLGGVSAPDAWSAQLWVRGAPWDQTRVYFDGLPLFNPLHAGGILSAITPDAIGTAFLYRGVPPVSLGGGAAGTVDVRSRPSRAEAGDLRLAGALSLASARFSLDRTPADGDGGWTTTWRRSYLDWLTEVIEGLGGGDDVAIPYYFYDITTHAGDGSRTGRGFEVSTLLEYDNVAGDIPDVLHRTVGSWGDAAAQITYYAPIAGLQTRHTVGFSGFSSNIRPAPGSPELEEDYNAPAAAQSYSGIWYLTAGGAIEPRATSAPGGSWALGYELVGRHMRYDGLEPAWYTDPYLSGPRARLDGTLITGVLWGERRWAPSAELTIDAGLRLEAGTAVRNGGAVRWMPRLAARYQLDADSWISAAIGRSYQYAQAVVPAGVALRGFDTAYFWLLAGEDAPAARSDIATLGFERWLDTRWLAAVSLYLRRTTGVAIPDPTPGSAIGRPLFVVGRNLARGAEFSIRRLAGRWTFSAAYALGASEIEAAGLRFPAPADRRHTFDATTMLRLGRGWRLGAAYTIESGAPYTRRSYGVRSCGDGYDVECDWVVEPQAGPPGAQRASSHQALDLLLDWTHLGDDWAVGFFFQLRNALNHRNQGRYLRLDPHSCVRSCGVINGVEFGYEERDEFEIGIPILPLFGFRIAF
ncbi:MAG TPA: TonB-dependent receptor [Longimicrobiales bacterium]